MLDARKNRILKLIIEDYVMLAEPIGSRTISRKNGIGISPATVRNEMADLEELGFIEQPHTSAGRVPSSRGYRYYYDNLMEKTYQNVDAEKLINDMIGEDLHELDEIMQRIAKKLTVMIDYPVIISDIRNKRRKVNCIQIMPVAMQKGMLIIVFDGGEVENMLIDLPPDTGRDELDVLSHIMTDRLAGTVVGNDMHLLVDNIRKDVFRYKDVWQQLTAFLDNREKTDSAEFIFLEGVARILRQPEFRDLGKLSDILLMLEEKENIKYIIPVTPETGIVASIGDENLNKKMSCCSIVSTKYKVGTHRRGTISVLGPTRMDYQKVYSVIDYFTSHLEEIFNIIGDGRKGG